MTPQELDYIETVAIKLRMYPGSVNDVVEQLKKLWELARLRGMSDGLDKARETIKLTSND